MRKTILQETSVEQHRQQVIDMISRIKTERFIKMIYGFVSTLYKQEG